MNRFLLLAAISVTSAALSISGCSDNSLGPVLVPTPTTSATAIATATVAPAGTQTSLLTLGNGQRAILTTRQSGGRITGTLQILAPGASAANAKKLPGASSNAFSFVFRVGTYQITGTFTPPRSYSIVGTDAGRPLFTMTGLLPTATEAGSYSLVINNERDSGTIPPINTATPTSTPQATATAVSTATPRATSTATARPTATATARPTTAPGISFVENIAITPGAGFNGSRPTITRVSGATTFSNAASFVAPSRPLGGDRSIIFEGPALSRPARAGDTFALGSSSAATGILYYSEATSSGVPKAWQSTSGTLRVTSATAKSVTFTLQNVKFAPQSFGSTSATGTFSLNGTGAFNGL